MDDKQSKKSKSLSWTWKSILSIGSIVSVILAVIKGWIFIEDTIKSYIAEASSDIVLEIHKSEQATRQFVITDLRTRLLYLTHRYEYMVDHPEKFNELDQQLAKYAVVLTKQQLEEAITLWEKSKK